jgi:hypothetical protein
MEWRAAAAAEMLDGWRQAWEGNLGKVTLYMAVVDPVS